MSHIQTDVVAGVGLITLNRPQALNALTLAMVTTLTTVLSDWRRNPQIEIVAIRGSDKQGPFGHFCAGGDIRFFHDAAIAGDPDLADRALFEGLGSAFSQESRAQTHRP